LDIFEFMVIMLNIMFSKLLCGYQFLVMILEPYLKKQNIAMLFLTKYVCT
jgi:hypothetical protein